MILPSQIPGRTFIADVMLGKLARWLRMLGYDTAYERHIADQEIVDRVVNEGRWLLTRDRYLIQRKALHEHYTFIQSDFVIDQLRQLITEFHLNLILNQRTMCRCALCNQLLESIPSSQASPHVPKYVVKHFTHFTGCPECGRLYWAGTHWKHMQKQLNQLGHP